MAQNPSHPPFKTPNPEKLQSQETKQATENRLLQQQANVRMTDDSSDSDSIDHADELDDVSDHTSSNSDATSLDSSDPDSLVPGSDNFAMRQAYHAGQSSQ